MCIIHFLSLSLLLIFFIYLSLLHSLSNALSVYLRLPDFPSLTLFWFYLSVSLLSFVLVDFK